MALPSFTISQDVTLSEIIGDTSGSELTARRMYNTRVVFTCNVKPDDLVVFEENLYRIRPVEAYVNTQGQIERDYKPVQLPANDPGLNVEDIQYTVSVIVDKQLVKSWTFDAPNAGEVLNLATVAPIVATNPVGITRGPVGPVGVDDVIPTEDGTAIQFRRAGINIGDPIPLPAGAGGSGGGDGGIPGLTASAAELNILDGASVSTTELNYVDGVTSPIQAQLDSKAPAASPTFTGTVSGITKAMVGLGSVDNTADSAKNVLSATKLTTARTINGVSFDGTANITVSAVDSTAREAAIAPGTTAQYWRGDKSWQTLNADAVPGAANLASLQWAVRNQGRAIPSRRTNFRPVANTTSPPTSDDTGQTVAYTQSNSGGALKIVSGRLTMDGGAGSAGYRHFDAGASLTRLGARFTFNGSGKTTYNGAVALVMFNETFNSASTTLRFGAHLVINPNTWVLQKYNNSTTTFTDLASGTFAKRLATNNVTEYEAEIYKSGSTLYVVLPDGSVTSVTDTDIATWAGNFGLIECSTNATTDMLPGFTETWADTGTQNLPSADPAAESLSARGELAYAQITTAPALATAAGAGAAVSGLSITVPYSGRPVVVEAICGLARNDSGGSVVFQIVNAAGTVVQQVDVIMVAGPLTYVQVPVLKYRIPAGAAGDTYTVRAYGPSGSQMNVNGTQSFIQAVAV